MTISRPSLSLRCWLSLAGFTLLCFGGSRAQAWNGTGHMTVADIAYDNLTPKTKAGVDALLARHRDYALWMRQMPTGYPDRARFAFMKAATWPDDVRRTPDDRPIWHYVDLPVIAPGYTPDPIALLPVTPNAETQIAAEGKLLTTATASDQERAVALCWVEHLIGDIHQPLHDSSLFSPMFPKGDKGGNDENLAANAVDSDPLESAAHPRKLHALWDDLLGAATDPRAIQKIAAALEKPAYGRSAFPQLTAHRGVHEWIVEGNALAQRVVYLDGTLPLTATGSSLADVTLPPGYLDIAHQIAKQQIALAGMRLADTLNAEHLPTVSALPVTVIPAPAAPQGQIIGNKRSLVYHLPGAANLPAERNRVYFRTEADAQAAGYHKAGSPGH